MGDGPRQLWFRDRPWEAAVRPEESVSHKTALFVLKTSVRTWLEKVTKYDAVTQVTERHQILH